MLKNSKLSKALKGNTNAAKNKARTVADKATMKTAKIGSKMLIGAATGIGRGLDKINLSARNKIKIGFKTGLAFGKLNQKIQKLSSKGMRMRIRSALWKG